MGWGRFGERLTDTQGERLKLGRREREGGGRESERESRKYGGREIETETETQKEREGNGDRDGVRERLSGRRSERARVGG